jgi:hypothetical protein
MALDMSKWPMSFAIKYTEAVKAGNTALVNAMKGGPNSDAYKVYVKYGTANPKLVAAEKKYNAAVAAVKKAETLSIAAYKKFYNAMYNGTDGAITASASVTYYRHTQNEGFVTMSTTGEYSGISTGDHVFIYPIASPLEGKFVLTAVTGNIARFQIVKQPKPKPPIPVKNPNPKTLIVRGSAVSAIDRYYKAWQPLKKKYEAAQAAYMLARAQWTKDKKAFGKTTTTSKTPVVQDPATGLGSSTAPVKKNLPAIVKEMYFPDTPEYNGIAAVPATTKTVTTGVVLRGTDIVTLQSKKVTSKARGPKPGVLYVPQGNVSQKVKEASELWENAKSSKGMIQQWMVPKVSTASGSATAGNASKNFNKVKPNKVRTAFQFIYNPSTIDMGWGGTPNVDPGLIMSGKDKIPFMGAGFTSSSVSFQILVNRAADMKYLTDIDSQPLAYFAQLYNRSDVTVADLKDIRDNGTMYDIEYLLNTLVPYKMKSVLRKKWTSDIGYLHSFPIELHLGKGLRYLGIISSFSVNHKIFNEDMVPIHSWVNITVSRIPDVAYDKDQIIWNPGAGV